MGSCPLEDAVAKKKTIIRQPTKKSLLDLLLDELRSEMNPETQARIDAEADRLEAEGAEVRWVRDPFGDDPFGDNWSWADPALDRPS